MTKTEMLVNLLSAWEGRGEVGKGNSGWFVSYLTKGRNGSWCAALLYTIIETVWYACGQCPPFPRTHGAKRLTRKVASVGREVKADSLIPGDFVCWNRGRLRWMGHVAMVVEALEPGLYVMMDGNVGKNAKVRRYVADLTEQVPWKCARLLG